MAMKIQQKQELYRHKKKQPNLRGITFKEKGMTHSIEITSIQIPLLSQTEKDKIDEGSKVDHIDTNGQDPSESQTNKSLNQNFAKKFKDLDNSSIKSRTMFKVNVWQRESNPDAYTPKMVSIGPYHKRDVQLHRMEHKLLYLRRFLGRKEGLDVESCIKELEGLKEEALKCYDDVKIDDFSQMLMLDGCFVVEFIRECWGTCPNEADKIINTNDYYIFRDLMLLENQLPFFVLNKLHLMTKLDDELPLAILVNDLVTVYVGLPKVQMTECYKGNIKHLLHVLHIFSCHGNPTKESKDGITYHTVMPNATELSEAGVKFVKRPHGNTSLFDIKFEKGCMAIPCFHVDDSTETILRNLIAYEQQSFDVKHKYFSDYSTFMDYLIDSDKDVNLLRQKGIIENLIGDDKEVTSIFNKMGTGVLITDCDFYYKEECRKAVKHSKKLRNKMMAFFWRNYCSNPCVGASTVAAILLLILTIMQAVLAFIDLVYK